jgi:hypothetical protein
MTVRNIILISSFVIFQSVFAGSNVISNVRENVTNVSQNSNVNSGIDLGNNTNSDSVVGNGTLKTENRKISGYNKVDITGSFKVNVNCNNAGTVEVKAESNILPLITSKISGDTLVISISKPISSNKSMELNIDSPQISSVSLTGTDDISIKNIKTDTFTFDSTGSDANIDLQGSTDAFVLKVTGDGKIDAFNLISNKANINVMGDPKVKVNAAKQLNINVTGDAVVEYKGKPKINKKMLGGEVKQY